MYFVIENDNGKKSNYACASYEEAIEILDNFAILDKKGHTGEIKHGEEYYSRIESETLKSYALSIVWID